MSTVPPPAVVALATCLLLGGAAAALVRAVAEPARPPSPDRRRRSGAPPSERIAAAAGLGMLVVFATRLIAVGVAAAVLVLWWRRLVRDDRAVEERRRIEAIASWLEDLRDTLRGSSIGVEEALEQVARRPPEALREPLSVFLLRRRQGFRTADALADLADGLAHPTADAAIAALRLVVTGTTGAARLHPTVSALAAAARDEVRARERVDRTRAVYTTSMQRLVVIAVLLVAYLRFAAGDLLDPYSTPAGQVFLVIPIVMWAGCIAWLRSLCRYEPVERYRIAGDDLAAAGVGGRR